MWITKGAERESGVDNVWISVWGKVFVAIPAGGVNKKVICPVSLCRFAVPFWFFSSTRTYSSLNIGRSTPADLAT